jgi:F420-dependent oxidoreductase-like protein
VQFSVWPKANQPWLDILDVATHVERTGWDGIWIADHFMPAAAPTDAPLHEGWTLLAGLSVHVPRLRMGMLVLGNLYRHPAVVANMAATLDHVCGGRVVLGIGAGWQANEHEAYGMPLPPAPERLARLDEACAVIKGLLTQPRTTFEGKYYTLRDAPLEPKPFQDRLPLLVGGGGEKVTLRIAARWADEWNTWGTPELLAHKNAVLDRHCAALGRDPATIRRSAQALVVPDAPGVETTPATGLPTIGGTAAQLRDQMARYADAGVDEFIVSDATAGRGAAKNPFFDWFADEVASGFR